jgi:hypothetical protein
MRIFVPLRHTPVVLLWSGLSLSAVGDQLYVVALTWIAVRVLGAAAGYLTALGAACTLLVALFAGRWADRWDQRRAMIGADCARAVVLVGVVAGWMASGRISAAPLVLAVLVLAAGQAVFRPALQSLLPALVPTARELPATNALFDATDRIARLVGPGLIALLAAVVPAIHFLTLDAMSFLGSAAALILIGRMRPSVALRRASPPGGLVAEVLRGFRAVRRVPVLAFEIAISGVLNGAWIATFFLALPFVIARHGAGLGSYGLVISAYGSTNLLATIVVGGRDLPANPGLLLFGGNVVLGTGILLMTGALAAGLPPSLLLPALAAGASIGAVGGPMHDIPTAVLRQTALARADVPAATRASIVSSTSGSLIAMLLAPPLLAALPGTAVMGGCGLLVLACGIGGVVRFARARSDLAESVALELQHHSTAAANPDSAAPGP